MKSRERFEGFRLGDLAGLVFGYGLAAVLARAFLPPDFPERGAFFLFAVGFAYLWLGLALSGPIVLTLDRYRRDAEVADDPKTPPMRHTRAELCWLLFGGYWFILVAFLVTNKLPGTTWPLFFMLPAIGVAALGAGAIFRKAGRVTPRRAWTHRAAVTLLLLWPVAWGLLIAIARELG